MIKLRELLEGALPDRSTIGGVVNLPNNLHIIPNDFQLSLSCYRSIKINNLPKIFTPKLKPSRSWERPVSIILKFALSSMNIYLCWICRRLYIEHNINILCIFSQEPVAVFHSLHDWYLCLGIIFRAFSLIMLRWYSNSRTDVVVYNNAFSIIVES